MKQLLFIAILISVLVGCGGINNDANPETSYEVKIIDGCEYIYVSRRPYSAEFSLTHKGDCNNPIHKPKVEYQRSGIIYFPNGEYDAQTTFKMVDIFMGDSLIKRMTYGNYTIDTSNSGNYNYQIKKLNK